MKPRRLPIVPTLVAAYREWWRALSALRPLMLNGYLIVVAIAAVADFIPARLWNQNLAGEVMGLVDEAIRALLLAPIVIAVHRFVIRNEVTRAYTLPLGEPAFRVFAAWLFALSILAGLPLDLLGAMQALGLSLGASTFGVIVLLVAATALALRLTLLLPAIAVEAPGARPGPAMADTKGQGLRLFAIFFLAILPWLIADIGAVLLLGRRIAVAGSLPGMLGLVMGGVLQTALLSLMAVIASLAFIALGTQVRQAGASQPGAVRTD